MHEWHPDGTLLLRATDPHQQVEEVGFSGFVAGWVVTR
jgi:hypothetical protein